jgi:S-DNA-T family DNA segregation ATPase FtsK/SpoIIIE
MRVKKLKLGFVGKRGHRYYREIFGLLILTLTAILFFSLFYYLYSQLGSDRCPPAIGEKGCEWARELNYSFGLSAFLFLAMLFFMSCMMVFSAARMKVILLRLGSQGLLFLCAVVFLSVFFQNTEYFAGHFGKFVRAHTLDVWFGKGSYASYLVAAAAFLIALMSVLRISLLSSGRLVAEWAVICGRIVREKLMKPSIRAGVFLWNLLVRIARACEVWVLRQSRALQERVKLYLKQSKTENVKNEPEMATANEIAIPEPVVPAKMIEESNEPLKRTRARAPIQQKLPLPEKSSDYTLPVTHLLDSPNGGGSEVDRGTIEAGKVALQKKLEDLGIKGKVVDPPQPGPIITMYRFDPDPGVKVRRIVALADDLAMALKAFGVRVLAPIPGESVVGIEVPNPRREKITIFLKEIIESDSFQEAPSKLTLALGKQISGEPFVDDLARMPHLLVAGATGTGKSVSLNAMILSMLFKASPQDVKFIMIDPKMLELAVYEEIPHLLVPVVTDPKKAASALFWAMEEMDRRYRLMREKSARNIDHYNRLLEREVRKGKKVVELEETDEMQTDLAAIGGRLDGQAPLVHSRLPRIVIIIDELADLMMTVRRDIEEHITRLAQKARAAGIHLIIATQRPSVDVITGLIKANFPARISFQVTSRVDSRTILDSIGAEKLLGNGDMLFLPPGTARLVRVHGAYVSNHEVQRVVQYLKSQGRPEYRPEILESRKAPGVPDAEDIEDEIYDQAVACVVEEQQASISMVQRRLRIGYNRAARLIDRMEKEGIVGPADGAKPREVFIKRVETG